MFIDEKAFTVKQCHQISDYLKKAELLRNVY